MIFKAILSKLNTQRLMAFFLFLIGILTVFLGVGLSMRSNNNYYISTDNYDTETTPQEESLGPYTTSIKYDNAYYGIEVRTTKEALELITKDSLEQKRNCPSSIQKIEDRLITKYDIKAVNLCEMDYEFAEELESVFEKIYQEYPGARNYLTNLTLKKANEGAFSNENRVIAAFQPALQFTYSSTSSTLPAVFKMQVLLTDSYFLNIKKLESSVAVSSNKGWFPKNSNRLAPLAHELGHYLSFLAMMKSKKIDSTLIITDANLNSFYDLIQDFNDGTFSLNLLKEAYQNYQKDTKKPLGFDEWRGTISTYALAKDEKNDYIYDETIAEAFHDVYLNGNKATNASLYIVKVLKNKLNG